MPETATPKIKKGPVDQSAGPFLLPYLRTRPPCPFGQ